MGGRRTLHPIAALVAGLVLVAAACTPPPTGGGGTSTTTPSTYKAGRCVGAEGVTVIVDLGFFSAPNVVRCALGSQSSGFDALANAGVTTDPGGNPGTVCQLAGLPTQGFPYCWVNGYWSYWIASGAGQPWTYSEFGAGAGPGPQPGSVQGWRFGLFADGSADLPPDVATG